MNTNNLTITLDTYTLDEIKMYALATGVSPEEFIENMVVDFIRFQQAEMEEVYMNDDGTSWLVPKD